MRFGIRFCIFFFLSIAQAAAGGKEDSEVHWNLSSTTGNAQSVYQGYIGFGIEMKSWPDYAGVGAPNYFSNYLLSQLASRTGNAPIHLRIGGTSGDNTIYDPSLNATWQMTGNQKECRLHTNVTLGKPWLEDTFSNLNASFTRFTIDIPFARLNKTNGIAFASACIQAMPSKTRQLVAIEIGNEPNLYTSFPPSTCSPNTDRRRDWDALDYSKEWTTYAKNITDHVGLLKQSGRNDWFQALGLASSYEPDQWNFTHFWDKLDQGRYVKTVSQHYYQVGGMGTVTDYPVAHRNTVNILETKFRYNLNFLKERNIPFILGEVGTVLSTSTKKENQYLYNSLGSALWTLDFLLYGMSMGIKRVSMQMSTTFKISPWRPVKGKAVHGNFYGLVAGADFIGELGNLQVRNLSTDGHPNIAGYAGYNAGKLSKVAVLNLNLWNWTAAHPERPKRNVDLSGLGDDVKSVRISILTAPDGAADQNITWAGKWWTAEDDGKEYQDGERPVVIDVRNGAPVSNVTVWASEAALVEVLRN